MKIGEKEDSSINLHRSIAGIFGKNSIRTARKGKSNREF